MKQLTIRGFGDDLERVLIRVSREEGISLNKAVLRLLRRGAGLESDREPGNVVGSSLDHLLGTWSADDERSFDEAVEPLGRIDPELWK